MIYYLRIIKKIFFYNSTYMCYIIDLFHLIFNILVKRTIMHNFKEFKDLLVTKKDRGSNHNFVKKLGTKHTIYLKKKKEEKKRKWDD